MTIENRLSTRQKRCVDNSVAFDAVSTRLHVKTGKGPSHRAARPDFVALATMLGVLLVGGAAHAQSVPVMTSSGWVDGNSPTPNGITSFLGIPYAAPPVGPLRWHAPEAAPLWTGVRKTVTYGNSCFSAYPAAPNPSQNEDCLSLNVWTPAPRADALKPVMVYIYGGGFQFGTSDNPELNGANLAARDVVVVTFNYRTGVLGFLATPTLDNESGTSGMWGIQDQIAALKWVKRNIVNFGGDPNRVTVFGESAGSHSIGILLASPQTRGLINRAIMESGAFWDSAQYGSLATHQEALALGDAFSAKFPERDLRSIDAATLNAAAPFEMSDQPITLISPSVDGNVLQVAPAKAIADGAASDIPILAGWNAAEYYLFEPLALPASPPPVFDALAQSLFGSRCLPQFEALYPATSADQAQASAFKLDDDLIIALQTWQALTLSRRPGAAKAYGYNFTYTSSYSPVASHTAEVPFVWGTTAAVHQVFAPTAPAATAADQHFSDIMMSYWTNFAHDGDPNGPGLPTWPVFTGADSQVMDLNASPFARANTDESDFKFLAAYRRKNGRFPEAWRTLGIGSPDQYHHVNCDG